MTDRYTQPKRFFIRLCVGIFVVGLPLAFVSILVDATTVQTLAIAATTTVAMIVGDCVEGRLND